MPHIGVQFIVEELVSGVVIYKQHRLAPMSEGPVLGLEVGEILQNGFLLHV